MFEKVIVWVALFLIYYNIGGLATTNILRLTRGCTVSVLCSSCFCDNCGCKIPPLLQLPVISYFLCKGKCENCNSHISVFPLFLEIVVSCGMFAISLLFNISLTGICLSFGFYEVVRIVTLLLLGKRENRFVKNYIFAVISIVPFFIFTSFVSLIYSFL